MTSDRDLFLPQRLQESSIEKVIPEVQQEMKPNDRTLDDHLLVRAILRRTGNTILSEEIRAPGKTTQDLCKSTCVKLDLLKRVYDKLHFPAIPKNLAPAGGHRLM